MDSYNLIINKGITFSQNISVTGNGGNPFDLSGYALSGFLKFRYSDTGKLTSLNPSGVLPLSGGVINISIPATGTVKLPISYGFYDIQLFGTGIGIPTTVIQALYGKANIFPEVTY